MVARGDRGSGAAAPRLGRIRAKVLAVVAAIRAGDSAGVESAVMALSRLRRPLAPLALMVGAFAMLFDGVKLLFSNWRLALIEALPAMWVWLAMLDLRVHLFRGRGPRTLDGTTLVVVVAAVTLMTMAAFFLNGIFAFALSGPGVPRIGPAFNQARAAAGVLLGLGFVEGVALGVATMVSGRWGRGWFVLSTGVVVGCIMFSFLAVPARLLGLSDTGHRYPLRDRLVAAIIGGAVGATVCTPPYMLGRLGVTMLGTRSLLVPAVIVLVIGFGLQAAAAGSVKAIRMSYKLTRGMHPPAHDPPDRTAPLDTGVGEITRPPPG